ncbi:hypothetical protein JB92DRAFT_3093116 [Gautieria morchelliformis]|nr:hypothetical protein JB92DRAFT_3093116 [Gautieria morchelliformis]
MLGLLLVCCWSAIGCHCLCTSTPFVGSPMALLTTNIRALLYIQQLRSGKPSGPYPGLSRYRIDMAMSTVKRSLIGTFFPTDSRSPSDLPYEQTANSPCAAKMRPYTAKSSKFYIHYAWDG